ncbi:MAG: ribbon-helix-helix protein, CopG family [Gammaproteobacteria bacterium]|nr:ribbon-helix-helix protein, CopG family [Gammaproteobacteria bacterium]
MVQITTRLSDELLETLDNAASALKRSRAGVVRLAVERYLEDYEDLSLAVARLQDPTDPVLDWDDVKRALLAQD